ncbi:hypothetical protein [Dehalobacter sp. TBBPA1]|uniref:putative ABC transporter permease subunit n=1 Tax=Dehalobacter sp. TBBPA1 TaxID=3235037 RepID=UPI0034A2C88F
MKMIIPPPLDTPPAEKSFVQDFVLLLTNQLRVTLNTLKHQRKRTFIGMGILMIVFLSFLISMGAISYGMLKSMQPETVQGFLSLFFLVGLASQIFFGLTAAFAALYMSEDLELLFMAPVPLRVVFAVKTVSVLVSNLLVAFLFVFLPGVFCGLLFEAKASYYLLVFLSGCGLWLSGTALAELLNLLVMRIVPPHRSKEAVGLMGGLAGVLIALVFQIPGMMLGSQGNLDIGTMLAGKEQLIHVMNFFPWGWGSLALTSGITDSFATGLGWSLLILIFSAFLFLIALILLERGFRQGFISISQGDGGRRRKKRSVSSVDTTNRQQEKIFFGTVGQEQEAVVLPASTWAGMWAVAKKDLLTLKRDTREWFSYLIPLIIMAFFVVQFLFNASASSVSSLVMVLIMYTIMFSGNLALQAFGREGESDWLLNSVPLAGWPVVWGKLTAAVLPTLLLMEALLVGTSLAVGVSTSLTLILALAAIFLSLGSSAIGLYYSIKNCRYNPDKPQMRISPSASLMMYLINFCFILILGLSLCYLFPPAELVSALQMLPPVTFEWNVQSGLLSGLYFLSRPLFWPVLFRTLLGILLTGGLWLLIFFGFMTATVRQSRKGFRVELVTTSSKNRLR